LPNQFEITTQKYNSRSDRYDKKHKDANNNSNRPQQDVANQVAIPSEEAVDADVNEQLEAWQKEVANVERSVPRRRYDHNRIDEDNRGNAESSEFNRDSNRSNRRGDRNNNNRRGGDRNRNKNRNNRRFDRFEGSYKDNSFEQKESFRENFESGKSENVQRIDSFKESVVASAEPENIQSQQGQSYNSYNKNNDNKPKISDQEKATASKLIGLWKKITS
jgi:hypothetical protein